MGQLNIHNEHNNNSPSRFQEKSPDTILKVLAMLESGYRQISSLPTEAQNKVKGHRRVICHQLTDSGGRCPALCLRGGRGLT